MTDDKEPLDPEVAATARKVLIGLAKILRGEADNCLHCEAPIETLEQVGDCVYAFPCGCRQYQGKVPNRE